MNQKHKSNKSKLFQGLIFGIIFGFLLQKGGVTKYNVIVGQLLLKDFTVVKIILTAIVTGMLGIYFMKTIGWIDLQPKSGSFGKNIIGGLIFGIGFALLGYCPGTLAGAMGNGYIDAVIGGIAGILTGISLFAYYYPKLKDGILKKGEYGNITLPELFKVNDWAVVIPMSAIIILLLYWIESAGKV